MARRIVPILLVAILVASLAPAVGAEEERGPTIEDNIIVKSFDDTPIVATLMLPEGASAENPVPVVLKSHGWGGNRDTEPSGVTERLINQGYAIFTWDERGFGQSGGEAHIDAPAYEVKDVIKLIDYLSGRPEIQKDGPGDIRAGWIGGSYAGGIQLNTSAFDHRVDALVPEIPWANLVRDLFPNKVLKRSWDQLLYGAGAVSATTEGIGSPAGPQTGNYAEEIHRAEAEGSATGTFPKDLIRWFYRKSTIIRAHRITVPTMVMQGTVDTLFPLEDGFDLRRKIKRAGTRVKLVTFCGGHTLGCPYPGGATGHPKGDGSKDHYDDLIVNWLNRYVKNDTSVDVGPNVEWQAQNGRYYGARRVPLPGTHKFRARRRGISLAGPGGSGGDGATDGNPAPREELGASAVRRTLMKTKRTKAIVGVPKVRLRGSVTAAQYAYVFFELVDRAPNGDLVTVDDQTMPLRLKAGKVRRTVKLHGVSWLLKRGHKLMLEVTTGSAQYDTPRTGPYTVDLRLRPLVPVTRRIGRRTT